MTAYDDPAIDYDDADLLYNGAELNEHVTLIVADVDVTDELADQPITIHVGTHGNSLGTLDAALDEPAVVPSAEDRVAFYAGQVQLFTGAVKSIVADERHDGSLVVAIGAQDEGPDPGALPDAAPFGVSDDADGVTTQEYVSLSRQTRTTEGGSPKTTYQLVIEVDGLKPNQNVEITSSRFGLVAEELEIVEMTATWLFRDSPRYTFTIGDPRVSMAQLVEEHEIPDGSITETKISDGAISTPKLAADAVIANVANVGGSVVIDSSGITVSDGAIAVENDAGTVIIDGSSNMFKIQATGTLNRSVASPGSAQSTVTLSALGLPGATPAHISYVASDNTPAAAQHIGHMVLSPITDTWHANDSNGADNIQALSITGYATVATQMVDGEVQVKLDGYISGVAADTFYARYYVLVEAAL